MPSRKCPPDTIRSRAAAAAAAGAAAGAAASRKATAGDHHCGSGGNDGTLNTFVFPIAAAAPSMSATAVPEAETMRTQALKNKSMMPLHSDTVAGIRFSLAITLPPRQTWVPSVEGMPSPPIPQSSDDSEDASGGSSPNEKQLQPRLLLQAAAPLQVRGKYAIDGNGISPASPPMSPPATAPPSPIKRAALEQLQQQELQQPQHLNGGCETSTTAARRLHVRRLSSRSWPEQLARHALTTLHSRRASAPAGSPTSTTTSTYCLSGWRRQSLHLRHSSGAEEEADSGDGGVPLQARIIDVTSDVLAARLLFSERRECEAAGRTLSLRGEGEDSRRPRRRPSHPPQQKAQRQQHQLRQRPLVNHPRRHEPQETRPHTPATTLGHSTAGTAVRDVDEASSLTLVDTPLPRHNGCAETDSHRDKASITPPKQGQQRRRHVSAPSRLQRANCDSDADDAIHRVSTAVTVASSCVEAAVLTRARDPATALVAHTNHPDPSPSSFLMSASASSPSSTTPHKEQNGFTDYYLQTRNCSTTKADTASDWHCDTEGAFNDASPGDRFVWARSLNEESLKSAVPPQLAPIAEASVLASFRTYRPFATSRCGTLQISATTTNDGNSARAPPSVKGVHSPHSTLNGLSISPLKVPSITASRFVDDDASTECARCDMSTPVHSQTNDAQPARPPTFGEGTVPNEPAAAAAVAAATAAAAANAARHHPKALTHIQPAGSGPGVCHFCQSRRTGQWRRGPAGQRTLCNACGINWTKKIRAEARRAACSLADAETRVCRVFEKVARVLGIKAIVVQSGGATEEGAGGRRNSAPGDGGDDDSDQRSGNGDDGDEEYERESAGSGGGGVVLERSSMLDGVVLVPGVACWNALVALAAAACPDSVTGLATPVASGKLPAAAQNASNPALAALAVAAAATPPANHTGGPAARHNAPHHPHLQPVGGSAQPRTPAPHSASHAATATLKRRASEPTGAPGLAMTSPPPRKQQRRGSSPRQATATLPPLSLSLSLAAAAAAAQCDVERTAADAAAAGLAALRGSGSRTAPWTSGSPAIPARRGGNGVMGQ